MYVLKLKMDVLKKFSNTKRQLQSLRKELNVCEKDIKQVEAKLQNTTTFGDIIVKNAKYVKYSEHVQIYYSWLKTKCLIGLKKDKSDAKWSWFDFQRESDINYYLENEDTLYLKALDIWEKTDSSSIIVNVANNTEKKMLVKNEARGVNYLYPHPSIKDYNEKPTWPYEMVYKSDYNHFFSLSEYKEELKRCEEELKKVKNLFNTEFDKLNEHDYRSELSCLMMKRGTLMQSINDAENTLEIIISEIDSITDDYDELRTTSNISTISSI
jgi:chaperonin cofactor prefoldin